MQSQEVVQKPRFGGRIVWSVVLVVLAIVGLEVYQSFESQFLSEMATKQLEDSATGYAQFRFFASRNTVPNLIYAFVIVAALVIWTPFFVKLYKYQKQAQTVGSIN